MFNSTPQNLVHLPRRPTDSPDHQLPRGECRFILPDAEADGSRPRCCCQTFWLNKSVPGSMCECGHQAWHHVSQPSGSAVSMEDFAALTQRVKQLEQEREREFARRNAEYQVLRQAFSTVIDNVKRLRLVYDDKIEDIVDKIQRTAIDVEGIRTKLEDVDDATMKLEDRMDLLDKQKTSRSRSMTPIVENATGYIRHKFEPDHPQRAAPIVPILRTPSGPWSVRLNMVLSPTQQLTFEYGSSGFKRLESRKLVKDVNIPDQNASSFAKAVESVYWPIFNGRPWKPMVCYRSNQDNPQSRLVLHQLNEKDQDRAKWDFQFLEEKCLAHDKAQGDVIFIALQNADLSWTEIKMLPSVPFYDESCWNHDPELDGDQSMDVQMDFKMDITKDSASAHRMYEYSDPPPTYSKAYNDMDRLEVLATLAGHHQRAEHTDMEVHSLTSLESRESRGTDDEHRDKKPKLRSKKSEPNMNTQAGSSSQAPIYLSGRSKRKMPANHKNKEPVRFGVGNWKSPMPSLLNRNDGKEKGGNTS